jgi:hypothetical protein
MAQAKMIRDFYIKQVSEVTHIPVSKIRKMRMFYGPSFFTLKEKIGVTARLAQNGNVAGDLMGNGHFLTSGGSMTGMIGHANRYIDYWQALNKGGNESRAARKLMSGIKKDSEAWLHVSSKEFFDVAPVNFGAERASAIGVSSGPPASANLAKPPPGHGLAKVLGQSNWATAIKKLQRGDFGKPGVDFYVPRRELDVTKARGVTVETIAD